MKGKVEDLGDKVKKGEEKEVEVIKKDGGIKGEKVVMKFEEDEGEKKKGV